MAFLGSDFTDWLMQPKPGLLLARGLQRAVPSRPSSCPTESKGLMRWGKFCSEEGCKLCFVGTLPCLAA